MARKFKNKHVSVTTKAALVRRHKKELLLPSATLVTTAAMKAACETCEPKVDAIVIERFENNNKFRDQKFDLHNGQGNCLYSSLMNNNDYWDIAGVKRIPSLFKKSSSWTALSPTISSRVLSVTVSRGTEEIEGYGFIFFKDGGWVSTIVDDQLFYGINRQSFKTSLCFGACRDECKTWLSLLEKAYVKIHGDYKSIDGGYTAEGIEDLLGVIPSIICSADILSKDRFWDGEMRQVNRTLFMGCAIAHVDIDGQMDKHGIQSSHAYSVLRVEEHKGGHFVQLRDPWGRVE